MTGLRVTMLAVVSAMVVVVSGCNHAGAPTRAGVSTVAGASTLAGGTLLDTPLPASVADLPLIDEHGHRFTLASLHGHTVVLGDFLTLCQEVCPMTTVNLRDVAARANLPQSAGRVQVVEATVDPTRDSPARLVAYEKQFGPVPGWTLATGSRATLEALWSALGVYHAKVGEQPGSTAVDWWTGKPLTFDIEHQDVVYVIDARGHLRWVTSGNPDTAGQRPPPTMLGFLSDEGRATLRNPQQSSWTVQDVLEAVDRLRSRNTPSDDSAG